MRSTDRGDRRTIPLGGNVPDQLTEALTGADPTALADDVTLATPLALEPIRGKEAVNAALAAYAKAIGPAEPDARLAGSGLAGIVLSTDVGGDTAQVLALASRADDGPITAIHMYGRPWPFMALLRERLGGIDTALIDPTIGAAPYSPDGPGTDPIEGPPLPPLAAEVEFHSPILTATAKGREANERILTAAAQVYGMPTYRAVLQVEDQPAVAVLFDGHIDDNVLQLAAIFGLNPDQELEQIRIFSRPWPITAYFRARMYPLLSDLLGPEYWRGRDPEAPLPID
jgi:hypothetical protein